ncbi:MAG: ABC transporter permease, partial [Sneathiella sp.]|nr:ABC transporter permease [Sneathiella sp.]
MEELAWLNWGFVDWNLPIKHWEIFAKGMWITVSLTAISLGVGWVFSVPFAFLRANRHPIFNRPIWVYTYVFRGTPLLIQLFLVYYGVGQFEFIRESFLWVILKEPWWCALITFSLNSCAYQTEILRGSIEATPHGEVEAAIASGMSPWTRLRRITLPSSFRRALPAYSNEIIFMLHGSVVASTITIVDILGAGRIINGKYYVAYEGFLSA